MKRQNRNNTVIGYFLSLFFIFFSNPLQAQETKRLWTETDRKYLVENMRRTRDELIKETENLTSAQWSFQESPDRWSIAQVVEHLALWEIAWAREIGMGVRNKPQPELAAKATPDSYYTTYIMEDKAHVAPEFARPTGYIEGKNALAFFRNRREQAIAYLDTTQVDMRMQFELTATSYPRNMHHVYIYQWGHVDRHLRQIKKIKQHKDYPKGADEDRMADKNAIMQTIQHETDCFYARDYNCWKENYVQETYTHQGWSNGDGTFDIRVGWDKVNAGIEKYIKENPIGFLSSSSQKKRVERRNIAYKFYGDLVCYMTWEQYQESNEGKKFNHSHEMRLMEKRNGQWKIACVAAFWDYKNLVSAEDLKP